MRDWITIALLCSFLRLQLVCGCGALGYCDSAKVLSLGAHVDICEHHSEHVCCRLPRQGDSKHSDQAVLEGCHSQHSDDVGCQLAGWFTQGSISPICADCDGSRDQHNHFHHYWISHGNFVSMVKSSLKAFVGSEPTTVRSSWSVQTLYVRRETLEHDLYAPPTSFYKLYGHWRI